jgi:glutamyl-tRNA reductase
MPYLSLHVTGRDNPLETLERLTESRAWDIARRLQAQFPLSGVVPLRTCHRFEIYTFVPPERETEADRWLRGRRLGPRRQLRRGSESVEHLFSVASGIDSPLLGEQEILGQVRDAYFAARERGLAGSELGRLFERAIFVGRKVRESTGLSEGGRSLARLAVEEVRKTFPDLTRCRIGILGSGKMGEKVARRLLAEGVRDLWVGTRTLRARREVETKWGVRSVEWQELLEIPGGLDILFCALGAERPVVRLDRSPLPGGGRLTVVDLGNPRNVERGLLPAGVHLVDLDDLREASQRASQQKAGVLPQARRMVQLEAQRFVQEVEQRDVARFAQRLFRRVEEVLEEEKVEALSRLRGPHAPEKVLDDFAHAFVKRLLTPSVTLLKSSPARERARLLAAAERLLPLHPGPSSSVAP